MKFVFVSMVAILSLACGSLAVLPTVTAALSTMPPSITQTPANAPETPEATKTPSVYLVAGCWHIRTSPGDFGAANVAREICNEWIAIESLMLIGGWLQIDGGYLCGRAIGLEMECK